jgi:hypothetical protein
VRHLDCHGFEVIVLHIAYTFTPPPYGVTKVSDSMKTPTPARPELSSVPSPARRGRPAKHASPAERQRAYRARQKERGMREVKTWSRDVRPKDTPLRSDIIDLSEVRRW